MADFGVIPKGERYGLVPAFALAVPGLKPGPKLLYAALCTFASPQGVMFHSANGLAKLLDASKRQVQRWLKELEVAGLITRLGFHGRAPRFLIIRNPEGVCWAKSLNLKAAIKEKTGPVAKARQVKQGKRKGAATDLSPPSGSNVTSSATPVSSKHDLTNMTTLTGSRAGQEKAAEPSVSPTAPAYYGLRSMKDDPARELVQVALGELAKDLGGWPNLFQLADSDIAKLIARASDGQLTPHQVLTCLQVGN